MFIIDSIYERRTLAPIDDEPGQESVQESGQGLAEYALILALVAVVVVAALIFLQGGISGILSSVGSQL